jgi:hypothetical protein
VIEMISAHTLTIVSMVGSALNVVGSLYLAYDLLGGEHGPLRTLTRAVTYGLIFGVGFGIALGPLPGLAIGVTHGASLGWELSRVARGKRKLGFWLDVTMSAIRGIGFALATALLYGKIFGVTFGAFSTVGQTIGYSVGVRPSLDYAPSARPRMTRLLFLAVVIRTVGYGIAGYVSSLVAHERETAMSFGLKAGLLVGAVTAVVTFFLPLIEWRADHMPAKRMGVTGVVLILIGFALQSVQYWVALMGAQK